MKRGSFAAGFLTGLLVVGVTTTAYAAGIMAERSTHRVFVDGREVQMEAYVINGNNYVKLRDIGDTIKLTTQLGTRSYEVYSASKIGVDDTSVLSDSTENIITLVTCVKNQPDYRWCVQAREK